MSYEVHDKALIQATLLLLGAAAVLLPLMTQAGNTPLAQPEELLSEPGAALSTEDLTKLGVSKVDAIFILRQESLENSAGDAGR